jgi:hypothetical protein
MTKQFRGLPMTLGNIARPDVRDPALSKMDSKFALSKMDKHLLPNFHLY